MATQHTHRYDPLHVAALCAVLVLALVMLVDPLFPPSPFRLAGAVGGYDAVDALGHIHPDDTPHYTASLKNNGPNEFGFNLIAAVAMDPIRHWLFVVDQDNGRVMVFELDVSNQLVDRIADHIIGKNNFKDSLTGTTASLMTSPAGVAVDEINGRLFVSDRADSRVLVFDIDDGITDGEDAINVLGQPDFTSNDANGGFPEQQRTMAPQGLAYDTDNDRLFVAEPQVGRVTVWDVASITDGEDAINVLGQANFTSSGGATTQNRLNNPNHVVLDATGQRLFVGDLFSNRVMVFDVNPGTITDGELADNVLGHTNFTAAGSGLGPASMSYGGDFNAAGLAYDESGDRLFVSDGDNERILVFSVAAITDGESAVNVLGQTDFVTQGGSVGQGTFGDKPAGLLYDADNDFLYAPDQYYHRVLVFAAAAITNGEDAVDQLGYITPAGDPRYDVADFDFPNNGTSDRGFAYPESIALDTTNHRMFVTDADNNRILVFDLDIDNLLIDRVADHVLGQEDLNGRGTDATADQLWRPSAISYRTSANQLFVSDQDHNRVLVFDTSTITNGEDAAFVLGQDDFTSIGASLAADRLDTPRAVAVDDADDQLFVVDAGNNRVLVFDLSDGISDGEPAVNVLGQPDFTSSGSGDMDEPMGVAFDGDGQRLFVVDAHNNRVLVFDLSDGIDDGEASVNTLGTGGTPQSTLSVNLLDASFTEPCLEGGGGTNTQPAFDSANNRLFVPDSCNNRVMVFDTTDIEDGENAVDVVGADDFTTEDGGIAQNRLNVPQGLAFNEVNNYLYVADSQSHRVMVFEVPPLVPGATGGHEATDVLGQLTGADGPDFDHNGINNSPNSRGTVYSGTVVVDEDEHRLFLADVDNARIMVFELDENNILVDRIADNVLGQPDFRTANATATQDGLTIAYGLAYDPEGQRLFATGGHRVLVFDLSDGIDDGELAINVLGQPDFTSNDPDFSPAGGLEDPNGLWYDISADRLFVSDYENNRVLVFDLSGGITDGMDAANVLGQEDFDGDTPTLDQDGLTLPNGLVFDPDTGWLFVGDSDRIMVFDLSGGITDGMDASWVLGQPDFTSNGDGPSQAEISTAGALHYNGGDLLFSDDYHNERVMVWDVADITNGEDAVNVLGQNDFDTEGAAITQDGLGCPEGVFYVESSQQLFVSDACNARTMIYDLSDGIDDGEDAVDLIGQLDENDEPVFTTNGENNAPNAQGFGIFSGMEIAIDTDHHRVFVAEDTNNRIMVFNLTASNQLDDSTADAVLCQPDFKTTTTGLSSSECEGIIGLSYDGVRDLLFAADSSNDRVLVFDTATIDDGEDAINVFGQTDFTSGDCNRGGGADADTLCGPTGVSIEPFNNLLAISDNGNNRVLLYDLSGGITDGMAAGSVFGQPDFTSGGTGLSDNAFNYPWGVLAETNTDSLWVADSQNHRVLRFDLFAVCPGGICGPAVNVLGQPDDGDPFDSNDAATTQSGMGNPVNVALLESDGADQRLFVVERDNSRVLVFDTSDGIANGEDAVDAYGQEDFNSDECAVSQTNMCLPMDVDYVEGTSTLWVADAVNNRVLLFGPVPGGGGGPDPTPEVIGFIPQGIVVNDDEESTDTRNVEVLVNAGTTRTFEGRIDVVLSNDPGFHTGLTFSYNIPGPGGERDIWPVTIAWDLCFGIPEDSCDPGAKTVYARFYANVPAPSPAVTPLP